MAALDTIGATQVSIHAPNEGSDYVGKHIIHLYLVSIHAPNEGSDPKASR